MIPLLGWALAQVPAGSSQLLAGVTDGTETSWATLTRYERRDGVWEAVGEPIRSRLGASGLAWGTGLHPVVDGGIPKREGDGRSPMGIFRFGTAFADHPPELAHDWPILQTTARDLWVEDPSSAAYNTHVRVPEGQALTAWEQSQRMKLGDAAHQLKLVVEHNTSPPVAGAGSAIFLHIWRRQGGAATSGCTALPEGELKRLLDWLEPAREPVYVLLPEAEWRGRQEAWDLPRLPTEPPGHTEADLHDGSEP